MFYVYMYIVYVLEILEICVVHTYFKALKIFYPN